MITLGIMILIASQIFCIYCKLYQTINMNYSKWIRIDKSIYEIVKFLPNIARHFVISIHYQMIGQYVIPVLLWSVMIYLYKRKNNAEFPYILL